MISSSVSHHLNVQLAPLLSGDQLHIPARMWYDVPHRSTIGSRDKPMPDDHGGSSHVSLRLPNDLIAAFDKLASVLDRPRSWVMLRALRQYLDDEGAEIIEDAESLAELGRGETVSAEDLRQQMREIIARAEKSRASEK
jgi:predicted transcriptional regulator